MKNALAIAATIAVSLYGCAHAQPPAAAPAPGSVLHELAGPSPAPKPYKPREVRALVREGMIGGESGCDGDAEWLKRLSVSAVPGKPDEFAFTCNVYTLPNGDCSPLVDHAEGTINMRTGTLKITTMDGIDDPCNP